MKPPKVAEERQVQYRAFHPRCMLAVEEGGKHADQYGDDANHWWKGWQAYDREAENDP